MSLIVRVVSLKDKPALTLLSQNSPADLTLGSQLEIEWEVSFLVTISFGDITDKKQLTLFCFALFFFFFSHALSILSIFKKLNTSNTVI